jgi:hypothetical protein
MSKINKIIYESDTSEYETCDEYLSEKDSNNDNAISNNKPMFDRELYISLVNLFVNGDNKGIIYMITNKINNKKYIGQTKTHRGNSNRKKGTDGRFKQHIWSAENDKNCCPRLYNAIRKYGSENFVAVTIVECSLHERDYYETLYIRHFNTTDDKIGYNILEGGGVNCNPVVYDDDRRAKMSNACKTKTVNVEPNIRKVMRKIKGHIEKVHTGYSVRISDDGEYHNKWFSSREKSLEENLQMAKDWLNHYKNGSLEQGNYVYLNKSNNLPKFITYEFDHDNKNKIAGYAVAIVKNGKKYCKSFTQNNYTLEEKFKLAEKWIYDFNNGNIDKNQYGKLNSKNHLLPKGISELKKSNSDIITGYFVKVSINKKLTRKRFTDSSKTLEINLQNAVKYRDEILSKK